MPKQHTPKSLSNLFDQSSGSLARIAEKSQYLNALNQNLAKAVGATIAQNCRVSNYNQGILTIETLNSAFATRLNFMLGEILLNFRRNVLPELADIRIKVVPNQQFYASQTDSTKKTAPKDQKQYGVLSNQAALYIQAVADNAPDSLKKKLERLANLAHKKNQ